MNLPGVGFKVHLYAVEIGAGAIKEKSLYSLLKQLDLSSTITNPFLEHILNKALVGSLRI